MATINEKMTTIADAIREKTGGTEPLGLDAMAAAIAALETGGGLPETVAAIDSGIFTTTSDTSAYTTIRVPHGLGEEPDAVVFYYNNAFDSYTGYYYAFLKARVRVYDTSAGHYGIISTVCAYRTTEGYVASGVSTSKTGSTTFTDSDFEIYLPYSGMKLRKGSYKWAAIKFA